MPASVRCLQSLHRVTTTASTVGCVIKHVVDTPEIFFRIKHILGVCPLRIVRINQPHCCLLHSFSPRSWGSIRTHRQPMGQASTIRKYCTLSCLMCLLLRFQTSTAHAPPPQRRRRASTQDLCFQKPLRLPLGQPPLSLLRRQLAFCRRNSGRVVFMLAHMPTSKVDMPPARHNGSSDRASTIFCGISLSARRRLSA